jgi:hypothetical protein
MMSSPLQGTLQDTAGKCHAGVPLRIHVLRWAAGESRGATVGGRALNLTLAFLRHGHGSYAGFILVFVGI